ncbi:hypothetical protein J2X31_003567 [Flavobacterium arsenatis]|uniref:Uncharacterized protein n=1 Tax=Flavobacterium arsenatis TaxID=1484332 RepID=A0ABU1TUI0_9FLAO|nr:hypothetical protein [Flavobacterium arsenatis]MDR6969534.1 hypothetical protein [Flavobacterium arsenatis]
MNKLSQKLLNLFLLSGIGFFVLVSLTFIVVNIWPTIWDEWNEYKKGEHLTSAKMESIKIIKNDYYSVKYADSLEQVSEHAWHDARKTDSMLSPNGAVYYELELQARHYSLQFMNLKDSIVYLKLPSYSFNPKATKAPTTIDISFNEYFPRDIIDDSLQLQLCYKDSVLSRFNSFTLRSSLDIGKGFAGRKNDEIKMISDDKKIVLYVKFKLE